MPGVLPMVAVLARRGLRRVVVAAAAVDEARLVDGIEVVGVETLLDAVEVVRTRRARRFAPPPRRIELVEAAGTRRWRGPDRRCRVGRHRRRSGPVRGARPDRGAARAGDRAGRWSRPAADRAARIGQDAPGADDPRAAAAARRCRSPGGDRRRVGRRRGSDRRAPATAAVPVAASHDLVRRRWSAADRTCRRARSPAPTRASCSWTSCPSSGATSWRRSASRWRRAGSRSRASDGRRSSRPGSSSSRR